eukprot:SAG31_NODE_3200_length_4562_cov_7.550955_1_plen_22_part_10
MRLLNGVDDEYKFSVSFWPWHR